MLVHWIGSTETPAVTRLSRAISALASKHPAGVALIQYIAVSAVAPNKAARKALEDMLRGLPDKIVCSSLIVAGSGFRAASVRSLVTGLAMLARPQFPHGVHASIREAARWHADHLSRVGAGACSSAALQQAVQSFIARRG